MNELCGLTVKQYTLIGDIGVRRMRRGKPTISNPHNTNPSRISVTIRYITQLYTRTISNLKINMNKYFVFKNIQILQLLFDQM